jgi:hypothetical protein
MVDHAGSCCLSRPFTVAFERVVDEFVREHYPFAGETTAMLAGQYDHGDAELFGHFLLDDYFEH